MKKGYGLYIFFIDISISLPAVLAQLAIALIAPVIVSLGPIWLAMRITVREAISTYGLSAATGLLARAQQQSPRLLLLTLSNTFRNKWRVLLTQVTLVASGTIFMMVVSTQESATYTFGDLLFSILRFNRCLPEQPFART